MHETEMQDSHDSEATDTSADHTPHRSNSPVGSPTQSPHTRLRSETITPRRMENANVAPQASAPVTVASVASRRRASRSGRRAPNAGQAGPSNLTTPNRGHENHPASGSTSDASPSRSPSPSLGGNNRLADDIGRAMMPAVGIVDADPTSPTTFAQHGPMDINLLDADMVMNMRDGLGLGALDVNGANDDLAMGAPPGAPGATMDIAAPVPDPVPESGTNTPLPPDMADDESNGPNVGAPSTPRTSIEATPRAATNNLPNAGNGTPPMPTGNRVVGTEVRQQGGQQGSGVTRPPVPGTAAPAQPVARTVTVGVMGRRRSFYIPDATPYREEDVLLSLQLLAYLSKYPHVRQAFYQPRNVLGTGDSIIKTAGTYPCQNSSGRSKDKDKDRDHSSSAFFKALGVARAGFSKDKDKEKASFSFPY